MEHGRLGRVFGKTCADTGFKQARDYDGNNTIDFNDFLALQTRVGVITLKSKAPTLFNNIFNTKPIVRAAKEILSRHH